MTPDWREQAACRDSDLAAFFPSKGGDPCPEAQLMCSACPVRDECLADALRLKDVHGYRGGTSGPERLRMIRRTPKRDVQAEIRRLRDLRWSNAAICLRLGVSDFQVWRATSKAAS
jgi:WhiB family redox-sensing transcriptional regulator